MRKIVLLFASILAFMQLYAQTNTFPTSGNVGIGTTSPENKLTVYSTGTMGYPANLSRSFLFISDGTYKMGIDPNQIATSHDLHLHTASGPIVFSPVNTERMRINSDGNVGIGTTTPAEKLVVNGNLSLGLQSQGAGKTLQFHQEGSTGSGTNHYINFGESGRTNLFNIEYKGTPTSPDNLLNIRKESTTIMTFTESGHVGIGTSTPLLDLSVGQSIVGLQRGNGSPNAGYLRFGDGTGWKFHIGRSKEGSGAAINTDITGALMTINDNGRIGIGTTSPSEKLEINGGISITGKNATNSVNGFYNCLQFKGLEHAAIVYNPGETNELMFGFHQNGNFYWGTGRNASDPDKYYMYLNNDELNVGRKIRAKELDIYEGGIQSKEGIELSGKYGIGFYGNAPYDTIDAGDGAKIYYDAVFGGGSSDWMVIEKTDGNSLVPDGGIAFTNKGMDNIRKTALSIKGGGNIGIGTTAPTEKLEVTGDVKADTIKAIAFVGDGSGLTNLPAGGFWSKTDDNLHYNTGNVGIGTTTPTEKLDVNGNINIAADSAYQIGGKNVLRTQSNNLFVGDGAGCLTTTGGGNLFMGLESGHSTTAGHSNSFVGYRSGYSNILGFRNSFIGYKSGYANTDGVHNLFVGYQSGYINTTGSCNSFVGSESGYANTTGSCNSFVGYQSGAYNTTGGENLFVGYQSGFYNATGYSNSFMGSESGHKNTTGYSNLFIGSLSGHNNTTGYSNSFIGYGSGYFNTTGYGNVFLGHMAGYNETSSNKLYIENSNSSTPLIYGEFDNDMLQFNGDVGIGAAPTGGYALYVSGSTYCTSGSWTASDRRYKKNITTISGALDLVKNLEGTQYEFKTDAFKSKKLSEGKQYGFIAQDMQKVLPELVKADEEGHYAINYDGVTPVLAEAIKELAAENDEQKEVIKELSDKIEELEAIVTELKVSIGSSPVQNDAVFSTSGAKLYQNTPNPFSNQTEIRYFLPDEMNSAAILVFDMNGKQLKSYPLNQKGNGNVVIYGNEFKAGMYLYALMANNKLVDTKRMVLTE